MHRKLSMHDNSDVQEIHNGRITDMRIECVMLCLLEGRFSEPELDTLYTELVQEFINKEAPTLLVSTTANHNNSVQGLLYLDLFSLDYDLVHRNSPNWPGDFDYFENAHYAIRVRLPHSNEDYTDWSPGNTPSVAALMAIMQTCRELSDGIYNNGTNVLIN